MKRFLLGLLISGILSYFAFRGLDWVTLKRGLFEMNYSYFFLAIPLLLTIQWIRSYRWASF